MDHLDATDDFERQYNFRFEEDGGSGSRIVGHSRHVEGSLRRKKDKRKRDRAARKERKELEKRKKREELKRLKNLKRKEIEAKLREIEQIAGSGSGAAELEALDLEGEWDPEAHDAQMRAAFNDDYYAHAEQEMDGAAVTAAADASLDNAVETMEQPSTQEPIPGAAPTSVAAAPTAVSGLQSPADVSSDKFDELYKLDYEDIVGGMPVRFRYRTVQKKDFGLTTEQILQIEERDMKQLVSLKKLAPYRFDDAFVHGDQRRRFLKNWRKAQVEREEERREREKEEAEKRRAERGQKKRKRGRGGKKAQRRKAREEASESVAATRPSEDEGLERVEISAAAAAAIASDAIRSSTSTVSTEPAGKTVTSSSTEVTLPPNKKRRRRKKRRDEKDATKPTLDKKTGKSKCGVVAASRLAAYGL
jgi:protein KRI1